eukprot:scaffold15880_cov31-Prasinocladus_malaysianus.AAC.1
MDMPRRHIMAILTSLCTHRIGRNTIVDFHRIQPVRFPSVNLLQSHHSLQTSKPCNEAQQTYRRRLPLQSSDGDVEEGGGGGGAGGLIGANAGLGGRLSASSSVSPGVAAPSSPGPNRTLA